MNVNNAVCASSEAGLDERIVGRQVCGVDYASCSVVGQELPTDRKTESVESVIVDEVCHLSLTVVT